MSKMKKIASLLLAVVMVLSLSCTAFADDTYTISLSSDSSGYTYEVYQILTGDLSGDGKTLSNVEWGASVTDSAETALLSHYNVSTVTELAEAIASENDAQALAEFLATLELDVYATLDDDNPSTSAAAGYYLIVNTEVPDDETNVAYSNYIVAVVNNLTITPKDTSTPTFDKEVTSTTDTDKETTADYDVGDEVEFTLTASLPSSISAYSSYTLVFHDTLSDGLSFNNDVTITVGGVTLDESDYTVTSKVEDDGTTTVTITISDLLDLNTEGVTVGSSTEVVVTYTAELTEDAETIENNSAYLEYSNNPNGDETGTTNTDKTYVITFELNVDKVDEDGEALKGAAFELYKYDEETETYVLVDTLTADSTGASFSIDGLAVGQYKLVESTTPDGYNTIDDIYFTIEATTSENESTGAVTYTVTIKDADGNVISTGDDATFSVNNAVISTEVENKSGSTLPSTGGIGTTIFYIVGTIMVLGAVVLLITRKRMSKAE